MDPVLFSLLFFLFIFLFFNFRPSSKKYKLLPSPSKLPFIGNLHQLHGSPHHTIHLLAEKHCPIMFLQLGSIPTLVVSSANMARDVMKTHDQIFCSRPKLKIPNRLLYNDTAFSPYSEYWRQVRKICVLQLLSTKCVQSYHTVREEEMQLIMQKFEQCLGSGSQVNLSEMFTLLTNNIVYRVVLGKKYGEGGCGIQFKELLKEFTYLLGVSNVADFLPFLGWINCLNGLNGRVEKNFRELYSFLDEVVEEHIEKNRSGGNKEEDFVDIMLRIQNESDFGLPFTRENAKAIILDMFAAGTDTTSVALEWIMSELLKHPNIMKEVRDVGKAKVILKEKDTHEMHILKSVIKESLRLHPPLPLLVFHESMEDVKLQGYDIPAKTTVIINAFAVGRDLVWWEEPEKFQPRRFLDGNGAFVDFKGQDFQLIPFGAGRRGCPGILFATSIIEIALANLLNKYDWVLPDGIEGKDLDMQESSGITIRRKHDLLIIPVNPGNQCKEC